MLNKKVMLVLALAAALGTGTVSGVSTFAANQTSGVSSELGEESEEEAANVSEGIKHVEIPPINIPTIRPFNPNVPSITPVKPVNPDSSHVTPTNPGDSDIDDSSNVNQSGLIAMYRLYNPNSGEHFYTANVREKNNLDTIGWNYEGIGWYAPTRTNGIPVYRLYNKNGGEHHYTVNSSERRNLMRLGWKDEGIGWYSYEYQGTSTRRMPKAGAVSLYRQYNPNAFANNHNYTTNITENNYLVSLGWRAEGVGWYGVKAGNSGEASITNNSGQVIFRKLSYNERYSIDLTGDGRADTFYFKKENDVGESSMHLNNYPVQVFNSSRGWNMYYYKYNNANEFLIAVCGQFGGNMIDIYRWQNGRFECTQEDVQFQDYDRKYPTSASGRTINFACSYYHGDDEEVTLPLTLNPDTHRFS